MMRTISEHSRDRGAGPSRLARSGAAQRCCPQTTRGFTLVEVLVTLVLLGIVIPVAMRGVSVALAAANTARRTAEAASLAEAKLNELIADGTWQTSGTTGDFTPDHPEFRWTCENLSRDYGTSEVALHVTWTQRGQERTFSLATLVYGNAGTSTGVGTDANAPPTEGE